jgi:hypothetical protein
LPDNIKTGGVAAGVADWTHRVAVMDRYAASQTPPPTRRVTTVKFERASSESRSVKSPISPDRHQQTNIKRGENGAYAAYQTQQQTYVGHASSSGEMMWRRQEYGSMSASATRLSPPISICSEKSA